jgi:glutathione S-transferase
MKLTSSIGPNPGVVTMFIAEKGIDVPTETIDIMSGENRQADFLVKNPTGGTPLLELDDGSFLSESIAICEYIEELHPAPALIGTTPEERAETRMWVRRIDLGFVQPSVVGFRGAEGLGIFKDRMRCLPEASAGMKAVAQDGLAMIDAQLADNQFVCGDRFTLADILLFCFTSFGAQVGQPADPALANLASWSARIAARSTPAA